MCYEVKAQEAFNFAFEGYSKSLFECSKERDGYINWFAGNVASGSAVGATTSLFLYHLDYAQTRLGTDARAFPISGKWQFNALLNVYHRTYSSDGIIGIYWGFGVSIMGITLYRGMYFGMYDTMKPIVSVARFRYLIIQVSLDFAKRGAVCCLHTLGDFISLPRSLVLHGGVFIKLSYSQDNFFASFFLGWSVTNVFGVCAYPFDTLRHRMMLTSGQPLKYHNARHAFHEIIHLEGFSALFRGVTANMLLCVAGAGVLAGYDQLYRVAYRRGHTF